MNTRSLVLRTLSMTGLVALFSAAHCGASPDGTANTSSEEIIGGVSAESPALDAVGALAMRYSYSGYPSKGEPVYDSGLPPEPILQTICSATLIGPQSVLTAKHCVQFFGYGGEMVFAMGPDATKPRRVVRVVDVETLAEPQVGGLGGIGADLAVVHLEEKVTDVVPQKLAHITDKMIGRRLVAVGYGIRNNNWEYEQRRLGSVTVRLTSGKVFEEMFGSYDAFRKWAESVGYAGKYSPLPNSMQPSVPFPAAGPSPSGSGMVVFGADGGSVPDLEAAVEDAEPFKDASPPPSYDSGPGYDVGTIDSGSVYDVGTFDSGSVYDPLREIYETELLADAEIYVGGKPGDAQPCRGDSGGPLLGKANDGTVRIFGVTSWGLRSPRSECDYGAVYASFSTANLEWLRKAANWVDPCKGITARGTCEGNVVVRCTEPNEGQRRLTRTSCAEIALSCGYGAEGATCQ